MNDSLTIAAGWLIDGTGEPFQSDVVLEIAKGIIRSIERKTDIDLTSREVVDHSHSTLIPCLVDCHVHLFMSGTDNPEIRKRQLNYSFEDTMPVIHQHLLDHTAHGVVALRDGGDHGNFALRYRNECLEDFGHSIQIKAAGKAWHARGRYGRLIGRPPRSGCDLAESIIHEGADVDHIKIVNSGINSLITFGKQTAPQFNSNQLELAVQAARRLGNKTMIHANGDRPVEGAVHADCDSIEHGFFMGKDNIQRMAEKGITWVPTVYTMDAYSRLLPKGSIESDIAARNLEHQLDQIRMADEYGVLLAIGTDAGSLGVHHGAAIKEEIRLFQSAGLTIEKVIQCAAFNGAKLLGIDHEIGTLSAGMPAKFLMTKGGPENLPESLESIEQVHMVSMVP